MSRILIIEDDALTAEAVAALLDHAGHQVVGIARDMTSALQRAVSTEQEILLVDIMLADGGDGIETARRLQIKSPVKVVFMSANHDERTRERAAAVRSMGFLAKPFSPQQLLEMLDERTIARVSQARRSG